MTNTPDPTAPIDAAEGVEGSQLLASHQWQRALLAADGDLWWPSDEPGQMQGPVQEVVLVPVAEMDELERRVTALATERDIADWGRRNQREAYEEALADRGRVERERDQLRDDGEQLRQWGRMHVQRAELAEQERRDALAQAGRLRAELEVVGARAGWASLLAIQLRLLVQAVEQAWAGAGQPGYGDRWQAVRRAAELARQLLAKLDQATAPPPPTPATGTTLTVPDSPKALRETLCMAQAAFGSAMLESERRIHVDRLGRLIGECDRHRPLGPDGRHGHRHTATCGCDPDRHTGAGLRNLPIEPAIADQEGADRG